MTKKSLGEALDRVARDLSPGETERIYGSLKMAVALMHENRIDEARDHIARALSAIVVLHALIYLECPSWCPPGSRPQIEAVLADLRRVVDLEKRSRESGEPPPRPKKRRLMN